MGFTRLDNFFHGNGYKHLTAKGLPFAVIQPGSDANPGSCKEALIISFGNKSSLGILKVKFPKQPLSFFKSSKYYSVADFRFKLSDLFFLPPNSQAK